MRSRKGNVKKGTKVKKGRDGNGERSWESFVGQQKEFQHQPGERSTKPVKNRSEGLFSPDPR